MGGASAPVVIMFAVLRGPAGLAEAALDPYRGLLEQAVGERGGRMVKHLSDGVMAVFESPADAVACSIAMQQAVAKAEGGPAVVLRVGLSLGEPLLDEADYFGTPVVVARRLCDKAEAGRILCTSLVADLASAQRQADFRSVGTLELKGIATPVPASEVVLDA